MSTTTLSGPRRQSTVRRFVPSDFGIANWDQWAWGKILTDMVIRIDGLEVYAERIWVSVVNRNELYVLDYDGNRRMVKRTLVYIRKG